MATGVELDVLLQREEGGNVLVLHRGGLRCEGGIEVIHVGLMVFLVVNLHDLRRNDWFQGLLAVSDILISVLAGHTS